MYVVFMNLLRLIRPQQWLKNLFIFLPLFFGGHIMDLSYMFTSLKVFFAYCFIASSIYCFNDIYDRDSDRLHPKKRLRPIANGRVSVFVGYILMMVMFTLSIVICFLLTDEIAWKVISIIMFYFIMNIAYCIRLKRVALIDVFIIAIGFVLRIWVGGIATGIGISQWIVLMTFLLALFLAFAKRRDDVVMYEESGVKVRCNINRYNLQFMNQAITIVSAVTMVCYIMYTVSPEVQERMHTSYLYVTSIFVLIGLLRYMQLTIVDVKSGSPTKILMYDRFIQLSILGWLLTFFVLIYL